MDILNILKKLARQTRSLKNEDVPSEEAAYATAFQKSLIGLANEVYGIADPFEIAQKALRAVCVFYDADWCGVFDADTMLNFWAPFWWYNKATDGMTKTQMENDSVSGEFARFRETIETNLPYYVNDVESLKSENVNEYEFLRSQDVASFLCVPYNRREQGIIFLRNPGRFYGQSDFLRIIANILVQEINVQKHLERMKINASFADIKDNADVVVNLFGGLEIITEQGKLSEAEMKSPLCSKIFVLLMLNRHRGMSAKELSEIIWSDKEYDNPTGNLRSTLYRLRNMFELMSENELIVTTKTGYRVNPKLKIHTDYECFEDICTNISAYAGKAERIEAMKNAIKLYKGKLFPSADGDHWHIPHSSKYHLLYLETLDKLMELLHETKDYKALHKYSMQAITIEPNSPCIICWLIIALRKHGALDMANKHMESAKARLLSEEYRDLEFRLQAVK